jgi:hypothetical protein
MDILMPLRGDADAETALGRDALMRIVEEHRAYAQRLADRDVLVPSGALVQDAKVLRGGVVTEGPFAETKERLGGFYVLRVAGWDEAVELARQVPESPGLTVELRAVHP